MPRIIGLCIYLLLIISLVDTFIYNQRYTCESYEGDEYYSCITGTYKYLKAIRDIHTAAENRLHSDLARYFDGSHSHSNLNRHFTALDKRKSDLNNLVKEVKILHESNRVRLDKIKQELQLMLEGFNTHRIKHDRNR